MTRPRYGHRINIWPLHKRATNRNFQSGHWPAANRLLTGWWPYRGRTEAFANLPISRLFEFRKHIHHSQIVLYCRYLLRKKLQKYFMAPVITYWFAHDVKTETLNLRNYFTRRCDNAVRIMWHWSQQDAGRVARLCSVRFNGNHNTFRGLHIW